jgi:hypothetical protein
MASNQPETASAPTDFLIRALSDANDRVGRLNERVGADSYWFEEIGRIIADTSFSPSNRLAVISSVLTMRNEPVGAEDESADRGCANFGGQPNIA